jgi:plasmid stabilization system protein ParE
MMFLVVWLELAFDEMDEIVRRSPARKHEFAVALRQLTRQLAVDPLSVGESRGGELRVMFAGELSVFYHVDTNDNTVEIGNVRLQRP